MRLNVGCGNKILDGWTNIDLAPGADIVADLRDIPLATGCADELMAIHVIEHFYLWEIDQVLGEWRRLLRDGGQLIIEAPDVVKCAKSLLEGGREQMNMYGFYGDPTTANPLMCHKWGWSPTTLMPVLERHRFRDVRELPTQFHKKGRFVRDMRLEAIAC